MENIRTRNEAPPAPKLPLTWDESSQVASPMPEPPEASVPEVLTSKAPVVVPAESAPKAQDVVQPVSAEVAESEEQSTVSPSVAEEAAPEASAAVPSVAADAIVPEEPAEEVAPEEPKAVSPSSPAAVSPMPPAAVSPSSHATVSSSLPAVQPQREIPVAQTHIEEPPVEIMTLKTPEKSCAVILKTARSEKGVSIKDVCRKTFITNTFIVDLENGNFGRLPDIDQCLAQLERLCREYDINAVDIVSKFTIEYETYHKENPQRTSGSLHGAEKHHGYDLARRRKPLNWASVLIVAFVLFIVMFLVGAFYFYKQNMNRVGQLKIDLTQHVPVHKPKPVYLDETRIRR